MFGAILRAIQNAIAWTFDFLLSGVGAILSAIGDAVPAFSGIDFAPISAALATANQYVPLDLLFLYLGSYTLFVTVFAATKIIIKLIPGLG